MTILKKISIITTAIAISLFAISSFAYAASNDQSVKNYSYFIGYNMGSGISANKTLKAQGINSKEFAAGFEAAVKEQQPKISETQVQKLMQAFGAKMQKVQSAEQVAKFIANKTAFVDSPYFPRSNENKDNKVMIIEFFDYQCMYCSKISPTIKALQKANPDVEFMFVEYPIFGQSFKESLYAAQMGVAVFKLGGEKAYMIYHDSVFNSHEDEGKLQNKTIEKAAKESGVDFEKAVKLAKSDDVIKHIQDMLKLGTSKIDITGTPFMIITSVNNQTVENTEIIGGFTSQENIQKAIDNVKTLIK